MPVVVEVLQEEVVAKMKTFNIFGYLIKIKDFCCSFNGDFTEKTKPYINLYIKITDICQANCPFCVFHKENHQKFNIKTALLLFVQRFIYRQLLFYVLLKAYLRAIKGELVSWGILKRTGNVKD